MAAKREYIKKKRREKKERLAKAAEEGEEEEAPAVSNERVADLVMARCEEEGKSLPIDFAMTIVRSMERGMNAARKQRDDIRRERNKVNLSL